jgi:hypothetical protein
MGAYFSRYCCTVILNGNSGVGTGCASMIKEKTIKIIRPKHFFIPRK